MSFGPDYKLVEHEDVEELEKIMKENKGFYEVYRHASFIRLLYLDYTITEASKIIGITRVTGTNWLKRYNEEEFLRLLPDYSNCGRKPKLNEKQMNKLIDYIENSEKSLNINMVHQWIKEELELDYSKKQVWK